MRAYSVHHFRGGVSVIGDFFKVLTKRNGKIVNETERNLVVLKVQIRLFKLELSFSSEHNVQ